MPRPLPFVVIPTLITTIYTIDTVAGGLQTISNVPASGLIRDVAGYIDDTDTPALDLYFFESAPAAIADNAAFTQAYAEQIKRVQGGKITVVAGDYTTENSKTRFEKKAVNLDYTASAAANAGYALYLYIVNRGTPTFASASALRLEVTLWGPNDGDEEFFVSPTIRAEDYGARPSASGATNRDAIEDAIAAASAAGGGNVILGVGEYTVSKLAPTPTNNFDCAIRISNRVQLIGEGMESTTIKLADGQNCSVISNYVSTDGIEANAQFCAIRNLKIDGNLANQTGTSHGIRFSCYPLYTQATNDVDFDSHQYFENVEIFECLDNGFEMDGRSGTTMINVNAYRNNGNGIIPSFDTVLVGCHAGRSGLIGFYTENSQVKFIGCVSFFSGMQSLPGHGFYFYNNDQGDSTLVGCVAQDNRGTGFLVHEYNRVSMAGCTADSNSAWTVGNYAGFSLFDTQGCNITGGISVERKVNGTDSFQRNALEISYGAVNNFVQLTHSAVTGATIDNAIRSASNSIEGNTILINAQGPSSRSVTYAASVTPDPYQGDMHRITLTGGITINATTNHHAGSKMAFIFTQDGTGGRVVTWNAQYKTAWTPNTAAGKINTIEFVYDGTNWIQVGATVGI